MDLQSANSPRILLWRLLFDFMLIPASVYHALASSPLSLSLFMSTCPERTQCTMGNQFEIGHRESPWRSRTRRYPGPAMDAGAGACAHRHARRCNLKSPITLLTAASVPACSSATGATFLHRSSRQLSSDQPPLTSLRLSRRDNRRPASMCAACIL